MSNTERRRTITVVDDDGNETQVASKSLLGGTSTVDMTTGDSPAKGVADEASFEGLADEGELTPIDLGALLVDQGLAEYVDTPQPVPATKGARVKRTLAQQLSDPLRKQLRRLHDRRANVAKESAAVETLITETEAALAAVMKLDTGGQAHVAEVES